VYEIGLLGWLDLLIGRDMKQLKALRGYKTKKTCSKAG
jgi:hypothetical protein